MKLSAAEKAHKDRVRAWVEIRPRSVRIPNGRPERHPKSGKARNGWKKGVW